MPSFRINENGNIRTEEIQNDIIFIGSSDEADIQIISKRISSFHCQIEHVRNKYTLIDLKTSTGTLVNGTHIQEKVLKHQDTLQIGEVSLVFEEEQIVSNSDGLDFLGGISPAEQGPQRPLLEMDEEDDSEESWDFSLDDSEEDESASGFFDITALHRDQLRNFLNLNMPINTSPTLNALLERIIEPVLGLTSSTGVMFLIRDEKFRLVPRYQKNLPKNNLTKAIQCILRPVAKRVTETNDIVNIPNITQDSSIDLEGEQFTEYQTILGIPLRTMAKDYGVFDEDVAHLHPANRTLGVLLLMRHTGNAPFTEEEFAMIEALSHQISVSIFNLKLHLTASADPLTGLYNRNYFLANLSDEIEFAKVARTTLSVAIMDLDDFKRFNELNGARAGDDILKSISSISLDNVRDIDTIARYGGEKFIFIFLHTTAEVAFEIMERIRKNIEANVFGDEAYHCTVSVGMSSFPNQGFSPNQLIERADQSLYRAKQSGKNQTLIWGADTDLNGERTDNLAGLVSGNLAKDYQHMQALMETIELANTTMDPEDQVLQLIAKVMEVTHSERAMIFKKTEDGIQMELARDRLDQDLQEEYMAPYSKRIVHIVSENKLPMHQIWDPAKEYQDEKHEGSSSRSVLSAPLREKEKDLGVLYLDNMDIEREVAESDITFFDAMAKQIAMALTRLRLQKQLKDKERMQYEINIAASIQADLLPSTFPEIPGISVHGYTEPAKEVGGDYYDIITYESEDEAPRYFLCIGDVSGKGLPAGLVMIMARSALRPLIMTGSMLSPEELLYHLNQMIYNNTSSGVFMSMLLLEVLADGVEYASAGHEHIIIFHHATQSVEAIRSGGVVLGLSPYSPRFENKFLPMEAGDFVLFYTDGATEAQDKNEEEFELERLMDLTAKYAKQNMTVEEMTGYIFTDIKNFFAGVDQLDDITLLIAKRDL